MSSLRLPTFDKRTPSDELIEFTQRPKTQVCRHWLRGACKNTEEQCAFLHKNRSIAIQPKNVKTKTCEAWLKGECTRQQSCWFLHEIRSRPERGSSLKKQTCQKWMKGKCAYKEGECLYRHGHGGRKEEESEEEEKKQKKTNDKPRKARQRDERDLYEIARLEAEIITEIN